jgi:gliding motility-associated lipoprotein GldH
MLKQFFWAVVLIMPVAFFACDSARVYEVYKPIDQSGWDKDSSIVFQFEIDDTIRNYNLSINVRNQNQYQYSNLWLFIDIMAPNQTSLLDTFEVQLARPDGKWLGNGIGNLHDHQSPYKKNVFFPVKGTYYIRMNQGMRDKQLSGINDIGLRVEKF